MDIFTFIIRKFRKIITGAPYRYDYFGDHLAVRKKVVPFLDDEKFNSTWEQLCKETNPHWIGGTPDIRWRIHICIWAAEACMRLEGDFAEFGVNTGLLSTMIMRNTKFDKSGKNFFLFDTYEGIPQSMASQNEMAGVEKMNKNMYTGNPANKNIIDFVRKQFEPYSSSKIVKGLLPGTIDDVTFDKLSYVSIDLNITSAEIAVIEAIWERITPGGLIILDDYGLSGHAEQKAAWDEFAKKSQRMILALPTGQGILQR